MQEYDRMPDKQILITSNNKSDRTQNMTLRMCSGAFKLSEPKKDAINGWINLKGHNDSHPMKGVLKECWENEKCQRDNFGLLGNDVTKEFGIRKSPTVVYPEIAPRKLVWPDVDWHVFEVKR